MKSEHDIAHKTNLRGRWNKFWAIYLHKNLWIYSEKITVGRRDFAEPWVILASVEATPLAPGSFIVFSALKYLL